MTGKLKNGQKVLCIGDSITDAGRRAEFQPLGNGYVKLLRDMIIAVHPQVDIQVINKGIGGNMVYDLRTRWDDDVMRWKPDWLTILIGINDLHRALFKGDTWQEATVENYQKYYEEILGKVRTLPCTVILMEPFFISSATSGVRADILRGIEPYRDVVVKTSRKFGTKLVKLHEIFQSHLKYREADVFCPEPVHPNLTGHLVIAQNLYHAMSE